MIDLQSIALVLMFTPIVVSLWLGSWLLVMLLALLVKLTWGMLWK